MAKTQTVDDFILHVGRSSRRRVQKNIVEQVQQAMSEANVSNSTVQFEENGVAVGRRVYGSEVTRRTKVAVINDKVLKKYGFNPVETAAYHRDLIR